MIRFQSQIQELSTRIDLLKKMPVGGICAEIGVFGGVFSRQILSVTKPKELHLIDPWEHQDTGHFSKADENLSQLEFDRMYQNLLATMPEAIFHRDYSYRVVNDFEDGFFDWIYIDGCHWYDEVKRDLTDWYPKVRVDGWICGHDYQIENDKQGSGVLRAVNELINDGLVKMVYIDSEPWVSYALKKVACL